jgi:hypothetical protein
MPNLPLHSDGSLAAQLDVSGLELVPAGVAAMVLAAFGAALVITALRRRDAEREPAAGDDESVLRQAMRVDA